MAQVSKYGQIILTGIMMGFEIIPSKHPRMALFVKNDKTKTVPLNALQSLQRDGYIYTVNVVDGQSETLKYLLTKRGFEIAYDRVNEIKPRSVGSLMISNDSTTKRNLS